jgi:hypothetical protein
MCIVRYQGNWEELPYFYLAHGITKAYSLGATEKKVDSPTSAVAVTETTEEKKDNSTALVRWVLDEPDFQVSGMELRRLEALHSMLRLQWDRALWTMNGTFLIAPFRLLSSRSSSCQLNNVWRNRLRTSTTQAK